MGLGRKWGWVLNLDFDFFFFFFFKKKKMKKCKRQTWHMPHHRHDYHRIMKVVQISLLKERCCHSVVAEKWRFLPPIRSCHLI
jgi:hypothetical protein